MDEAPRCVAATYLREEFGIIGRTGEGQGVEKILEHRIRDLGPLEPKRTAVLAIHFQNDVISPDGMFGQTFAPAAAAAGIVPRTAALLEAARRTGVHVVYVNVVYWPGYVGHIRNSALFQTVANLGGFMRGTKGVEIVKELTPHKGDIVQEHSRISAFFGNDVTTILTGLGIDTLIVTGVATNVAIDHTVRDAIQLGYRTILVEDCCCTADASYHEASLKTLRVLATAVLTAKDVIDVLDSATR